MDSYGLAWLGAGLGAGIALIGGGLGIGRLAASSVDAIARQPQSSGTIQTAMLITAGMIEGTVLLALVICIMLVFKSAP